MGQPAVRDFDRVEFKFFIDRGSYTAGPLHKNFQLYSESEFALSICSGERLDESQTLREFFLWGQKFRKFLKTMKNRF